MVSALGAAVLAASVFLDWYGSRSGPSHPVAVHAGVDSLGGLAIVLLVIAALALLDTAAPLARAAGEGAGGAVVLLGLLAGALVAFRMLQPPGAAPVTLREGAWIALIGSLMVSLGGTWPRTLPEIEPGEPIGTSLWSSLTGWTPNT